MPRSIRAHCRLEVASVRRFLACCAFVGSLCGTVSAQANPQFTNNPRFRIPFQSDPAEMVRIGASEVQLHVSTNGGASWSVAQSVAPQDAKFTFEAPANGEYLFAVRTIDQSGRPHPAGPLQPSLNVIVDDERPRLTLALSPAGSGQMEAVWQADDEHLNLNTLRLEYLEAATGAWQPLIVTGAAVGSVRFSCSGESILIRGSVADQAGNSTSADASGSAQLPALPTGSQQAPRRPDFREPIADTDAAAQAQSLLTGGMQGGAMMPMILPNFSSAPVPAARTSASQQSSAPLLSSEASAVGISVTEPPQTLGTPLVPGADHHFLASPPLMHDVRHVNSRSFRIGYELQDVGPSGVGSVELYITEDGGSKWFHYGADADRQSPFDVVVPRDGLYGFAIRVRNGLGAVADPPQPGEAAEIGIDIDQTSPVARLMPLQQTAVGGSHQVRIGWFIQDDRLAERPVALYQSSAAEGPWEPITGWMENQGRYLWTVSSLAPRNIFIRLEARDAAGNTTAVVSEQPLLIDTSRPTARILEIESADSPGVIR